jgi:uncharacterized protein YbgA (DUF1722 family)
MEQNSIPLEETCNPTTIFFNEYRKLFLSQLQKDDYSAKTAVMIHYSVYLAQIADQKNKSFIETVETYSEALIKFIKDNEDTLIADGFIKAKLK